MKIILTRREAQCLYWVSKGKNTRDVAGILGISYHTARWYLKVSKSKLDCSTLAQAVTKATKLRLIGDDNGPER